MKPLTSKSAVPARCFVVIASLLWLAWLSSAAYAEAARFSEATATAEKAIQDEEAAGETRFAAMNRQFLQLYQENKPFHEQPAGDSNP